MIGINYVHENNKIMEDRLEVTDEGLDSDIIGYPAQEPAASSSRKPSILRKQMLRRTTTRTRKRPPESAGTRPTDGDHSVAINETIEDASSSAPDIVQPITIPQISSLESEDGILSLQLLSELQLKKGAQIDRNNATKDGDDVNSSLDISIIESDDEASGVEVSLIEEASLLGEEESKALVEEAPLLGELEESKAEVEVDDEVDIVPVEEIPEEKPAQTKTVHTSAVATSNLSIVLSGNDIVVEYRDDKIKESLPPKAPSSSRQTLTPNRPKGIMKRPRHSKIKYHHPRRPLPPPLPPPGYKEVSTSPKSCVTATSIDSGYSSSGNHQPMKKRVSFNERELVEQYQMSRLRRKEKYDKRRSFLGILSMAMPVVMPYLMAVLILVASSMVPLPTDQNYQQQKEHALSMHQKFESNLPRPVESPVFLDVGSRMWEERRRANEDASAI